MFKKTAILSLISIFTISCSSNISLIKKENPDSITSLSTTQSFDFLNTKISLTTKEKGANLLSKSDIFTKRMSQFDLKSRLGYNNINRSGEIDYLNFSAKQVRNWSISEEKKITQIFNKIAKKINEQNLKLNLPASIEIVKSTIKEEGGAAGYTRDNYIVLNPNQINEHLILHELFHVFSRFSPEKRDLIYNTIGFKKTNKIDFPKSIADKKLTNPDAPIVSHYIDLDFSGKKESATIEIYSGRDYSGGPFFSYLQQKLMLLEGSSGNKQAKMVSNKPIMKSFKDSSNFRDKIGSMTNYTLHPEEICAEHFVKVIQNSRVNGTRNNQIINQFRDILKN